MYQSSYFSTIICFWVSIFRDNCEELRSTLTQRHRDEVFQERNSQLVMKEQQKKKDAEVDKFYADLWAKDIAIKSQREEETAREQIERNRETLKVLLITILVNYLSFAVKASLILQCDFFIILAIYTSTLPWGNSKDI